MKKVMSMFLMISLMASMFLFGGQSTAEAATLSLPAGYQFIDVSYSPQLSVYVAMAKDSNLDYTKLYTSTNLYDWAETLSPAGSGKNSAKTDVTQLLGWWSEQGRFVAAIGTMLYSSTDGYSWTLHDNPGMANIIIEINNGKLVVAGGSIVRLFQTLSTPIVSTDYEEFSVSSGQYIKAVGYSNPDLVSGETTAVMIDQYITWSKTGTNNITTLYPNIENHPVGISYSSKMNKWAVVNNTAKLRFLTAPASYSVINPIKLSDGTDNTDNLSSVFMNENDIIAGTSTGKIFTTEHTGSIPVAETIWTLASAGEDTAAITDKVVSICDIGSGKSLLATMSNLYVLAKTGSGYVYTKADYRVGVTKVALKKDIFSNVALHSVTYSPRLDLYVALGKDFTATTNTTGRIYTSKDGLSWQRTNEGGVVVDMSSTYGHGVIWWDAAQCFLIQTVNACVYSKNGYTWSWTDKVNTQGGGSFTVAGEKLYEARFGSKKVRVYTCLDAVTFPNVGSFSFVEYTPTTGSGDFYNKIAVDDSATPTIFTTYSYFGAIMGPNVTGYTDPTLVWKKMASVYAYGNVIDMVYSANQGKFIIAQSDKEPIVLVSKDGTTAKGPSNTGFSSSDAVKPMAITTNNTKLVVGNKVGEIYMAPDTTSFSTAVWTKINSLSSSANTYKIQSVCTGKGGNFVAVASAGNANGSEILYINADGSGYRKASEETNVTEISAGATFNVVVDTVNSGTSDKSMTLIVAVYSAGGALQQIIQQPATMTVGAGRTSIPFTANANITADSHMKIMAWNNMSGITPISGATDFFSR